jgi:hypothetical protein
MSAGSSMWVAMRVRCGIGYACARQYPHQCGNGDTAQSSGALSATRGRGDLRGCYTPARMATGHIQHSLPLTVCGSARCRQWLIESQRSEKRTGRPREAPLKACPKVKVFQSENSKFPCPKLRFLRSKISQPYPKLRFLSPDSVKISKNDATKQPSFELWQSEHEVENLTLKIGRWKDTK